MREAIKEFLVDTLSQIVTLDSHIILLVMLLAVSVILWDSFALVAKKRRKESGLKPLASPLSIDGSKLLPVSDYVSEIQGLAGRPDAVIVENGFIIPVEHKPLAKKMRDRYKAQILVYMRLIEEFEGKKPPYGYLILGPKCRRIKVDNSETNQAWLSAIIAEMREVLKSGLARAEPHPKKCAKCDVKMFCKNRADLVELGAER